MNWWWWRQNVKGIVLYYECATQFCDLNLWWLHGENGCHDVAWFEFVCFFRLFLLFFFFSLSFLFLNFYSSGWRRRLAPYCTKKMPRAQNLCGSASSASQISNSNTDHSARVVTHIIPRPWKQTDSPPLPNSYNRTKKWVLFPPLRGVLPWTRLVNLVLLQRFVDVQYHMMCHLTCQVNHLSKLVNCIAILLYFLIKCTGNYIAYFVICIYCYEGTIIPILHTGTSKIWT